MELQEALAKRASLRKFTGEMPTDAEIGAVLDAAYLGPVLAFHDMRISVITNPELLKEAQENGEAFNRMDNPAYMYGAPVWILLSAKRHTENMPNTPYTADMLNANMYWTLGSIIQNMHLKAVELDLAACPMNTTVVALGDNAALRRRLGIPDGHIAAGSIVIGKGTQGYKERPVNPALLPTVFLK